MTDRLTITLCGSLTRAGHDLHRVHRALALAGHIVHAPVPAMPGEPEPTLRQLANLDARHRAAIRQSDLVIGVVNDSVIGDQTDSELCHALDCGKPVHLATNVDGLIADINAGRLIDRAQVPA